jgi:hypothetical protein
MFAGSFSERPTGAVYNYNFQNCYDNRFNSQVFPPTSMIQRRQLWYGTLVLHRQQLFVGLVKRDRWRLTLIERLCFLRQYQ